MVKLSIAVLALAPLVVIKPAQGQWYDPSFPICMHVFGEQEGERMDCEFTSLGQCAASASGRSAMCVVNPYFVRPSDRHVHHRRAYLHNSGERVGQ